VAVLAGLGLTIAVTVASAATAAPQANSFYRASLSGSNKFAAYPDIAVGDAGLVVAVWTEGSGEIGEKHVGPLRLGWISDSADMWQRILIDDHDVVDGAVAVSGATAHVVWIRDGDPDPINVCYKSCDLSQGSPCSPGCGTPIAVGGEAGNVSEVSRVNLTLDESGTVHVVWAEKDNRGIYYISKPAAGAWGVKGLVSDPAGTNSDFPVIATNRFEGQDYVHVAWAREIGSGESRSHEARYCRKEATGNWPVSCMYLAGDLEHPARNLSIAADGAGNVYVVWDLLIPDPGAQVQLKNEYAIGYRHSDNNGNSWRDARTYPTDTYPTSIYERPEKIFNSGEEDSVYPPDEYVQFLRPQVSLAASGTLTAPVPVLAWHARTPKQVQPELAQASAQRPYKAYWAYATQPGSADNGVMYWITKPITLSTNLYGGVDMSVDSATAALAIVGDLNNVKDGGNAEGADHLNAVYHEQIGSDLWGVFYNSNVPFVPVSTVYLPIVVRNAAGGGGG
jgi:hypothetical protein